MLSKIIPAMFLNVGFNWLICTKQKYMKRSYVFTFLLLISLIACKAKNNNAEEPAVAASKETPSVAAAVNLIGSYVGSFGDNKITVLITKTTKDSVEGRSVVGSNDRPFSGIITQDAGVFNVVAKEPGGDQHDGTFNFSIDSKTPDVVKGSWKPYNPTENVTAKDYTLQRRAFSYLQTVGTFPEASKRLLKEEDVNNRSKDALELMRNEIFARHGYCFKKKLTREHFENKDWYIPNTADVKNDLTVIERKNITLIKKYEKYAEEYGDEFGR